MTRRDDYIWDRMNHGLAERMAKFAAAHTRSAVIAPAPQQRLIPAGQISLRAVAADDGTFEGYANLFGVVDTYGTRWTPGAWTAGGLDSDPYPLLWMHDPSHVIGTFTAREDDKGLFIQGRFDATPEGQTARTRAHSGSAVELSVGFGRAETMPNDPSAFVLTELLETSLITTRMASSPGAGLTAVRGNGLQTPTGRRLWVPMAGSWEEAQAELRGLVNAWAVETYGPPSEETPYYAGVGASFPDRVLVEVEFYDGRDTERWEMPYSGQAGSFVLGEPRQVEVAAVVTSADAGSAGGDDDGDGEGVERARQAALARARLLLTE